MKLYNTMKTVCDRNSRDSISSFNTFKYVLFTKIETIIQHVKEVRDFKQQNV